MRNNAAAHLLDNPIWNALTSDLAGFGQGTALAKHLDNTFVALADHSDAAFADLLPLVQRGTTPILVEVDPPNALPGVTIYQRHTLLQMVCEAQPAEIGGETEIVRLTQADTTEIAALIALTHLGPLSAQSMVMGTFIGLRIEGRLVAIAGQRLNLLGYREISTVGTHPDFEGRGYAARLVNRLSGMIFAEDKTPFLHLSSDNARAQRLYERLGFHVRREIVLAILGRSDAQG